jgi:hypothetical protein
VYYGSPGGDLHQRVFKYSHKDPRQKHEADVLRDITKTVPARFRKYMVAISVVKRCLHPRSSEVPKVDRSPHYERVFAWVVEHDHSVRAVFDDAQPVLLPYTPQELRELPIKDVVTTAYWPNARVSVGLRGVERRVGWQQLAAS